MIIVKIINQLLFLVLLAALVFYFGFTSVIWFPLGAAMGFFMMQIYFDCGSKCIFSVPAILRKYLPVTFLFGIVCIALVYTVLFFGGSFCVGFFWPSAATFASNNIPLNIGANFGMYAVFSSIFSKGGRALYRFEYEAFLETYHADFLK